MCGGYSMYRTLHYYYSISNPDPVNRDDFISRFKMTNYGREEVLRQVLA